MCKRKLSDALHLVDVQNAIGMETWLYVRHESLLTADDEEALAAARKRMLRKGCTLLDAPSRIAEIDLRHAANIFVSVIERIDARLGAQPALSDGLIDHAAGLARQALAELTPWRRRVGMTDVRRIQAAADALFDARDHLREARSRRAMDELIEYVDAAHALTDRLSAASWSFGQEPPHAV